uniref:TonB dependent receptor n=1 Tax=uncultured marine bacterium MedDCM-OCT-S09-C199 TaxID=743077 RepID=D6PE02_9BACT|nr:TonB dependent receptor [uncultured marine bacterium MedDCM-OCT-S09-C199]
MRKALLFKTGFATSLSFLVLLGTASVQAEGRQIEEVIVTAERQEASVQDTSISITALTGEFMEDFGIRNQEDFQNMVPATTIQPYDATVRGVGRNFRALGGDPGVATYINEVYSEDLLTGTAQTFWDVERVEVLRGPQGTLYGRNAVGGAINILYKEPTDVFEGAFKTIHGNFGTEEYYGAFSGPLVDDTLLGRINFAWRDRDGVVDELGTGEDLDGLGTENIAAMLTWTASDSLTFKLRQNWMDIERSFGGGNGGGLVVLNEEGYSSRTTDALVPGYRMIDRDNTDPANRLQRSWFDSGAEIFMLTNPLTGDTQEAQRVRPGVDFSDANGFQNAAASLDGFNQTSAASAATYNACVFPGEIDGGDLCAATNGLNIELFDQQGTQLSAEWDASDSMSIKYIFGFNQLSYQRITDDDNTASPFLDRQFYVNHEADYTSHELQTFWDINDSVSLTSGIFFYDATINQRGDFYSSVNEARLLNAYDDQTSLSAAGATAAVSPVDRENPTDVEAAQIAALTGLNASTFAFQGRPAATLFSAKNLCSGDEPPAGCVNSGTVVYTSAWFGDNGTNPNLNVINGPDTLASDLLYTTTTEREAFAAYSQGVWDINEEFTLTVGLRYASDEVIAEENLWRYSETGGDSFLARYGGLAAVNQINGGFELNDDGSLKVDDNGDRIPTPLVTNGGIPYALSVHRGHQRKDTEFTGRINLDWDVSDEILLYLSATSGHRSGGYNLVFFSATPTYDPEELIAYELGYKTQFLDDTLQLNGSFYYYDYENIHTTATERSNVTGSYTTSVVLAPGAEVFGIESELLWLMTDQLTFGGNFSYTPSEYTEDLLIVDPTNPRSPVSVYGDLARGDGTAALAKNIKGNQILQVPELKLTAWTTYNIPLAGGSRVDLNTLYSWIDEVYYSPFQSEQEKADAYGRLDLRATWTNAEQNLVVAAYVNNVLDDVGVLQVLRQGESEFFRHNAGITLPRMLGIELTYKLGAY